MKRVISMSRIQPIDEYTDPDASAEFSNFSSANSATARKKPARFIGAMADKARKTTMYANLISITAPEVEMSV